MPEEPDRPLGVPQGSKEGASRSQAAKAPPEVSKPAVHVEDVFNLMSELPDGVILLDEEGSVRFINPAAGRLLGREQEEILGRLMGIPVATDRLTELTILRADGPGPQVEVSLSRVPWLGRELTLCTLRDITRRAEAEENLRQVAERLETLSNATFEGILLIDEGRVVDINDQGLELFGYERDEMLGTEGRSLVASDHRDSIEVEELGGEAWTTTVEALRADGSSFWVEVRGDTITRDGRTMQLCVVRDIDHHKRLEQALGNFAHTISHDLKEPLRNMLSMLELLHRRHGSELSEDAQEILDLVRSNGTHMRRLIKDVLAAAERQERDTELEPVDVVAVAKEARNLMSRRLDEEAVDVQVTQIPKVMADPSQLLQVLMNLLSNAVEHGGHGTTVTIRGEAKGDQVRLSVEDDGPGMTLEEQEHVFEAFQRGRDSSGEGSGIGLATCRDIVERHGGRIWFQPANDGGARFVFTLAAAESRQAP